MGIESIAPKGIEGRDQPVNDLIVTRVSNGFDTLDVVTGGVAVRGSYGTFSIWMDGTYEYLLFEATEEDDQLFDRFFYSIENIIDGTSRDSVIDLPVVDFNNVKPESPTPGAGSAKMWDLINGHRLNLKKIQTELRKSVATVNNLRFEDVSRVKDWNEDPTRCIAWLPDGPRICRKA